MREIDIVFIGGWVAFWLYWLVVAFATSRGPVLRSRSLGFRAIIVIAVILVEHFRVLRGHSFSPSIDPLRVGIGLVLFVMGLGFAIWARVHIGRNWGTPMTQRNDPELVTSGPYRFVRHPIYSGILVAGVGTVVALLSWVWITAVVLTGIYFVYSATVEERYMNERFPESYQVYKRSTKMLVPFIF
ncbi:MAG: isoprenylcysteine carboxylmethyltransferase family protein [Actinomycetota bacterium]|nr:isoprenylcysteine carboxylmethyltransferase family protein [Actinomycetota bacterium]